jgi:hypothetical protein
MKAFIQRKLESTSGEDRRKCEVLSELGRFWSPCHCPTSFRGMPKLCYSNARKLAEISKGEMLYCEGYAYIPGQINCHAHPWCVSPDGHVIEVTWDKCGETYFGVLFDHSVWNDFGYEDEDMGLLRPHNFDKLRPDWHAVSPAIWTQ